LQDDNDADSEIESSHICQSNGLITTVSAFTFVDNLSPLFVFFLLASATSLIDPILRPRTLRTKIPQPHELAVMMDDNRSTKKGATTFVHGPEMEGSSLSGGDNVSPTAGGQVAQEEEIKRDLHSRHINMIAIAGMIVRVILSSPSHALLSRTTTNRLQKKPATAINQPKHLTQDRAPASSSDPAKSSRLQVRRALFWLTLLWA
jgi:hypothetical protein